jgi:hypothetical protein
MTISDIRRLERYELYIDEPFALKNPFRIQKRTNSRRPTFEQAKAHLPAPIWDGHDKAISCYWKAWQLAFRNLQPATARNDFVSDFIDTAFNGCIFMWDSSFIMMFTKYALRVFPFIGTLDNFYRKQHIDGFICREIGWKTGADRFERFDPASTGPNVLPWAEWEHYCATGDKKRLGRVLIPLVAYHRWLRKYHTWQNGTYWSSGWGCGMDNQRRVRSEQERDHNWWHGNMSWIDATAQQILSANILCNMAKIIGKEDLVTDLSEESSKLTAIVNKIMWNKENSFYHDLHGDGTLGSSKSIGAYWMLLAGAVPEKKLKSFVAHLENKKEFNRPHRVPTISADDPSYHKEGQYWLGGVWSPTNYMVLRGLTSNGFDDLAHSIALNHLDNVVAAFAQTGTLWENYAPEKASRGNVSMHDFVGWTGLSPISILFEYVFGLRPQSGSDRLIWDIRLLEQHGVKQYPFGTNGLLDLICAPRTNSRQRPVLTVRSNVALALEILWDGGRDSIKIKP